MWAPLPHLMSDWQHAAPVTGYEARQIAERANEADARGMLGIRPNESGQ